MRDEAGMMVSPAVFVPIAEQMGLIDKIGEWVLRNACRAACNWPSPLKVAVNLSPAQFVRQGLAARVAVVLAETGLEAERLELEITEGLLLKKSDEVMQELRALKALGVGIVMDDFGTGYSSLSYLWQFPFDKIKIDRSFMRALDVENHGSAATIIKTIIDLGRSLNVTVTVEGVEDDRQASFVTQAHCDQNSRFLIRPSHARGRARGAYFEGPRHSRGRGFARRNATRRRLNARRPVPLSLTTQKIPFPPYYRAAIS